MCWTELVYHVWMHRNAHIFGGNWVSVHQVYFIVAARSPWKDLLVRSEVFVSFCLFVFGFSWFFGAFFVFGEVGCSSFGCNPFLAIKPLICQSQVLFPYLLFPFHKARS